MFEKEICGFGLLWPSWFCEELPALCESWFCYWITSSTEAWDEAPVESIFRFEMMIIILISKIAL